MLRRLGKLVFGAGRRGPQGLALALAIAQAAVAAPASGQGRGKSRGEPRARGGRAHRGGSSAGGPRGAAVPSPPSHRERVAPEPPPAGELPGGGVGWSDAAGWNAAETRVGPIRRIPLDGLRSINADPAPTDKRPLLERADRRAVVLVNEAIDLARPVDLLLHLHGFDPGYRQDRVMSVKDPVRDKDVDRFEEQMQDLGPQLMVVLPQGGLHAGFSPRAAGGKSFDAAAFLDEVLERLAVTRLLPGRPAQLRLVLSAHSGGGEALGVMLEGARPQLVALFDAINGPREELPRVERWLAARLGEDLEALRGRSKEAQRRYLQRSGRFRAYFTPSRLYLPLHDDPLLRFEPPPITGPAGFLAQGAAPLRPLRQFLDDWLLEHLAELGGEDGVAYRGLRRNYQVVELSRASHGGLLGYGALRDALRALPPRGDEEVLSHGDEEDPRGPRPRS